MHQVEGNGVSRGGGRKPVRGVRETVTIGPKCLWETAEPEPPKYSPKIQSPRPCPELTKWEGRKLDRGMQVCLAHQLLAWETGGSQIREKDIEAKPGPLGLRCSHS